MVPSLPVVRLELGFEPARWVQLNCTVDWKPPLQTESAHVTEQVRYFFLGLAARCRASDSLRNGRLRDNFHTAHLVQIVASLDGGPAWSKMRRPSWEIGFAGHCTLAGHKAACRVMKIQLPSSGHQLEERARQAVLKLTHKLQVEMSNFEPMAVQVQCCGHFMLDC